MTTPPPNPGDPTREFTAPLDALPQQSTLTPNPTQLSSGTPAKAISPASFTTLPDTLLIKDLSEDPLLQMLPRISVGGKQASTLGDIPLLSKLGQGGMGAVYLGFHPRLQKEVAVKILPVMLSASNPAVLQRFIREAQLAAQVQSPHLVGVLDVNHTQGLFFIVMEYVRGKTAREVLGLALGAGKIGLDEIEALEVAIAATKGLVDAHTHGIVHRDVKPENILIPKDKNSDRHLLTSAKLADLGLARNENLSGSVTNTQSAMGTPGFMAPEQAMSAQSAGRPADVYGMAATLYALLAGHPPFFDGEAMAIILATLQAPHPPISRWRKDVSPSTAALLDRGLAKKPEERFADGAELLVALNAALAKVNPATAPTRVQRREDDPGQQNSAVTTPPPQHESKGSFAGKLAGVFGSVAKAGMSQIRYSRAMTAGKKALSESRWVLAEESFRQALEAAPNDPQAKQGVEDARAGAAETRFSSAILDGNSAFENKEFEKAQALYMEALKERPNDRAAQDAVQKVKAAQIHAQYETALAAAQDALKEQKPDADGHYSHLDENHRQKAEDALEQALALKNGDPAATALLEKLGLPATARLDLGEGQFVELALVPRGEFEMGSNEGGNDVRPPHKVKFSAAYYVAQHPVTVQQFQRFVAASGYISDAERARKGWVFGGGDWHEQDSVNWRSPGFGQSADHPVVLVSWNDARAFTAWLNKNATLSWANRKRLFSSGLPTEAQWEYAARGTSKTRYPWGNSWDGHRANHADLTLQFQHSTATCTNEKDGYPYTSPSGQFLNASWCGAFDMAGNVLQWCTDWYAPDYYGASVPNDPPGPPRGSQKVLRGGSWSDMPLKQLSFQRRSAPPNATYTNIGFRIVVAPQK